MKQGSIHNTAPWFSMTQVQTPILKVGSTIKTEKQSSMRVKYFHMSRLMSLLSHIRFIPVNRK